MPRCSESDDQFHARRGAALCRCGEQVAWYTRFARRQGRVADFFQIITVLLASTTPLLILWGKPAPVIQAIPAALAAVTAGLINRFHWREDSVRFSSTSELLKSERIKCETRTTTAYDLSRTREEALDSFVTRIEQFAVSELGEWRMLNLRQQRGQTTDESGSGTGAAS